jgi:hypothetical protein
MAEVGRRIKRIKNQLYINAEWLERHKNIRPLPYGTFNHLRDEIRHFMNFVEGQMLDINDRILSVMLMKLLPSVRI